MELFVSEYVGQSSGCMVYFIRPNFTPRKAGQNRETPFGEQMSETAAKIISDGNAEKTITDPQDLTTEQKEKLLDRLHYGRDEEVSPQEWDDFLADLVDFGIISNSERMYANGITQPISESIMRSDLSGDGIGVGRDILSIPDLLEMWTGNPLEWLGNMDVYLLKAIRCDELDGYGTAGLSNQRAACAKIAEIVRNLLADK